MKPIHKIAGIALVLFLMFMGNVPFLPNNWCLKPRRSSAEG